MKTDVIPYEDHHPTTMSISIDTIHTKFFHIKLTIAKGSIYSCLCYEEYVKSSRHKPTSNFIEFKASNTISINVPSLQNLGISSMLFATASKEDQMSNYVPRSLFISTELPLVLCQNCSHLRTVAVLVDPSSQDMSRCRCW